MVPAYSAVVYHNVYSKLLVKHTRDDELRLYEPEPKLKQVVELPVVADGHPQTFCTVVHLESQLQLE